MLEYQNRTGIALLTLDCPPVNALGRTVRGELKAALRVAQSDLSIRAIVISGHGNGFSAGADIDEFDDPDDRPNAGDLLVDIEESAKPVVAALHGFALGGGLELALACHGRVVHVDTMVGLPEVNLGLIPGAGGTQRLPRLVGVEEALNIMLSGKSRAAGSFVNSGLFDILVDTAEGVVDTACEFAIRLADTGQISRVSERSVSMADGEAFLAVARNAAMGRKGQGGAPTAIVNCLNAALTGSFREGLAKERHEFEALARSPESAGLRHVFKAERSARKASSGTSLQSVQSIERVGVVGAGTMGAGIAMTFANAGFPVVLVERDEQSLDRGMASIARDYQGSVKRGRITDEEASKRQKLIHPASSLDELADVDLVIEAVFEDLAVKQDIFTQLDRLTKAGAILATNTSTLNVNIIADATGRPGNVLGLHFFSPAHVMKLLEVVRADRTSRETLAVAMQLSKRIGKTAVVSGVCDGFIGNRMLERYLIQAGMLLDEGALPAQVDAAIERWGMALGPFRMLDLTGNDLAGRIRARRKAEYPDLIYSSLFDAVLDMGRLGIKAGKGWYDYGDDRRRARPSKEVEDVVESESARLGLKRRLIPDSEIVDRLLLALINEGAYILEEGIARRPSDIDVVYTSGYGFPRQRGGPMFEADRRGLAEILSRTAALARGPAYQRPEVFWRPSDLLKHLAETGGSFEQLNKGRGL